MAASSGSSRVVVGTPSGAAARQRRRGGRGTGSCQEGHPAAMLTSDQIRDLLEALSSESSAEGHNGASGEDDESDDDCFDKALHNTSGRPITQPAGSPVLQVLQDVRPDRGPRDVLDALAVLSRGLLGADVWHAVAKDKRLRVAACICRLGRHCEALALVVHSHRQCMHQILYLGVAAEKRGTGLARKLVRAVREAAKREPLCLKIVAVLPQCCASDEIETLAFWRAVGFKRKEVDGALEGRACVEVAIRKCGRKQKLLMEKAGCAGNRGIGGGGNRFISWEHVIAEVHSSEAAAVCGRPAFEPSEIQNANVHAAPWHTAVAEIKHTSNSAPSTSLRNSEADAAQLPKLMQHTSAAGEFSNSAEKDEDQPIVCDSWLPSKVLASESTNCLQDIVEWKSPTKLDESKRMTIERGLISAARAKSCGRAPLSSSELGPWAEKVPVADAETSGVGVRRHPRSKCGNMGEQLQLTSSDATALPSSSISLVPYEHSNSDTTEKLVVNKQNRSQSLRSRGAVASRVTARKPAEACEGQLTSPRCVRSLATQLHAPATAQKVTCATQLQAKRAPRLASPSQVKTGANDSRASLIADGGPHVKPHAGAYVGMRRDSRRRAPAPTLAQAVLPRPSLISGIFQALDHSDVGFLGHDEMRLFANLAGFDGNDSEWQEEFKLLCSEWQCEARGITATVFSELLNDRSARGCFCEDVELRRIHATIRADLLGIGKHENIFALSAATSLNETGMRVEGLATTAASSTQVSKPQVVARGKRAAAANSCDEGGTAVLSAGNVLVPRPMQLLESHRRHAGAGHGAGAVPETTASGIPFAATARMSMHEDKICEDFVDDQISSFSGASGAAVVPSAPRQQPLPAVVRAGPGWEPSLRLHKASMAVGREIQLQ